MSPTKRLFFLLSAGRSGTTLLYEALAAHPQVAVTNEAGVIDALCFAYQLARLPSDETEYFEFEERTQLRGVVARPEVPHFAPLFAEHARRMILEFYEQRFSDRDFACFGEKMPNPFAALAARDLFPDTTYFVHVRDPRDYLCSVRRYVTRPEIRAAHPHLDVGDRAHCVHWRNYYSAAHQLRDQLELLHYEKLVRDPEPFVRRVLECLGLEMHEQCADALRRAEAFPIHGSSSSPQASIGRWRRELTPEQVEMVEAVCGIVMSQFGYQRSRPLA